MDVALQTRAEQLAGEMADQARTIEDLNELMRRMMKAALERMLNTEMDVHLGRTTSASPDGDAKLLAESSLASEPATPAAESSQRSSNRRNGRSRKTVRADLGEMTIATPRIGKARSSRKWSASTSGTCRASTKRFWRCTPRG